MLSVARGRGRPSHIKVSREIRAHRIRALLATMGEDAVKAFHPDNGNAGRKIGEALLDSLDRSQHIGLQLVSLLVSDQANELTVERSVREEAGEILALLRFLIHAVFRILFHAQHLRDVGRCSGCADNFRSHRIPPC